MKKILLLGMLFAFIFAGQSYAAESYSVHNQNTQSVKVAKKANIFSKTLTNVKAKVQQIKAKVKDSIDDLKGALGGQLQTAIILMVIGLIFLILAGAIGGSIVWAVGAIFFVVGALFLLLYLL